MAFKENLLKKIEIDALAGKILDTLGPVESGRRIDKKVVRKLLAMTDFEVRKERDLELYVRGNDPDRQMVLVLDNELPLYHTHVGDVLLRKSPTVKEMISVRNAIKILNDKDVVVSKKNDTVIRIQKELVEQLDLSFEPADLDAIARDGVDSLQNQYTDGVIEALALFGELLGYKPAPAGFSAAHHEIIGRVAPLTGGQVLFGPMVIFNKMKNELKYFDIKASRTDQNRMALLQEVMKGRQKADMEGPDVFFALKERVLQEKSAAT